jgi:hypothetical protein
MKIDVEGAEGLVLRGAAGLLDRHQPVIYFECQGLFAARQGTSPKDVWDQLEGAGYSIFAAGSGCFIPADRVQQEIVNYLAIPSLGELQIDQPLDANSIIAIIDRWSARGTVA